jgi:hypothetical protein
MWELAKKRYVFFILRFIQAIYLEAVKREPRLLDDPWKLRNVNQKRYFTYQTYLAAVSRCGRLLRCVPEMDPGIPTYYTKEMMYAAIRNEGEALPYCPKIDTAMRIEAVKSNWYSLRLISKAQDQYETICMEAIKQNGLALRYVDKSLLSYEFCLKVIKQNGLALEYVIDYYSTFDKSYITYDLCMAAVKQNGLALEYVIDRYLTFDLCCAAVLQNRDALKFVPEKLHTLLADPKAWVIKLLKHPSNFRKLEDRNILKMVFFLTGREVSNRLPLIHYREKALEELRSKH